MWAELPKMRVDRAQAAAYERGMGQLLDDRPSWDAGTPDLQWRGLESLAANLAALTSELPPGDPILVTGDWGSGKTTLLQGVRSTIDAEVGAGFSGRALWFDAWRHEGEGALLPAIVRTLWAAVPQVHRSTVREIARGAWLIARKVAGAAAQALGGDVAAKAVDALTDALPEASGDAGDAPPADPMDLLRDRLATLLRAGWPTQTAQGVTTTPVVFIDDLDRCPPDRAVELLDQIRTLLAHADHFPCRFVIAMDRGILIRAISKKFEGIEGYDGNRYLEKLFPFSFSVPTPGTEEAASLASALCRKAGLTDADERNVLVEVLMQPQFANPRLMKRCINRLSLVQRFESTTKQTSPADGVLVQWIAAAERWPQLRRLMTVHDHEFWSQLGEFIRGRRPTAPGVEAVELLEQRGAREWLAREMFGPTSSSMTRFRDADLRLRRWGL